MPGMTLQFRRLLSASLHTADTRLRVRMSLGCSSGIKCPSGMQKTWDSIFITEETKTWATVVHPWNPSFLAPKAVRPGGAI